MSNFVKVVIIIPTLELGALDINSRRDMDGGSSCSNWWRWRLLEGCKN